MTWGSRRSGVAALAALTLPLMTACQASTAEVTVATASPAPPDEVVAAEKRAQTTLESLDRAQRVGQLLMVGVDVRAATRATAWVSRYHLGGVLLTGSTELTVDQAKKATDALHNAAEEDPRPMVAVDQGGGANQTLRGTDFFDIPSAAEQATWNASDTTKCTELWASALHLAGVDLTLSPVADTVLTDIVEDNPVVGKTDRALGTEPKAVSLKVDQIVKAITNQEVIATVRDFPGVGRLLTDPASSDSAVDAQMTIDDPQIAPFITGIEAGAGAVLISTATYPQLGEETPAVYAKPVISGLLRDVIGFKGVAISDDLSDTQAAAVHPLQERGVRFIQAGGDVVVSANSSKSLAILTGMLEADQKDAEFSELVDKAALRVLAMKAEHGIITCD